MTREGQSAIRAAEWVNRLDQPMVDTAAGEAFDRWMGEDPRNREEFADMQALWHSDALTAALRDAAERGATDADTGEADAAPRRSLAPWLGLAACAVLAFFLVVPTVLSTTYRTGRGNGERVILSDGTQVALSGEAELRVRMLPWRRDATLTRGEAFFDVTHDADRPFEVESGDTRVRVLGTAFNVDRQSANRTVVEVYRGAVAVASEGTTRRVLRKGEQTRVLAGRIAEPVRAHPATADQPDWTSGWFEADDVPLSVLIAKVQRYASQPIRLTGAKTADIPVSGRFRISQPTRVLQAIEAAYDLDARKEGGAIVIGPAAEPAA